MARNVRKVVGRVSLILAEHYAAKITATKPKERLEQLVRLLREEGGMLEVHEDEGRIALHKRVVPSSAWPMNIATSAASISTWSARSSGRRFAIPEPPRGSPCCVFELIDEDESGQRRFETKEAGEIHILPEGQAGMPGKKGDILILFGP